VKQRNIKGDATRGVSTGLGRESTDPAFRFDACA
jgi:hypothetical protein